MYQCAEVDQMTNQCLLWVKVGFLGLPNITNEQAGQICIAIGAVMALAWGYKKLVSLIK